MFDRVLRDVGSGVCRMLDVQYRMNRDICDWASNEVHYWKDDFNFLSLFFFLRVLRVFCFAFLGGGEGEFHIVFLCSSTCTLVHFEL